MAKRNEKVGINQGKLNKSAWTYKKVFIDLPPIDRKKHTDFYFRSFNDFRLQIHKKMTDWKEILAASISTAKDLPDYLNLDSRKVERVSGVYACKTLTIFPS